MVVIYIKKFQVMHIATNKYLHTFTDASSLSTAYFHDMRCKECGVYSTDPLFFTCELSKVFLLHVALPSGDHEQISLGDTTADVDLPPGFTAVSLDIRETSDLERNISLTLSIASASLLAGGEIRCDDTTPDNVVRAGCPLRSKLLIEELIIPCKLKWEQ